MVTALGTWLCLTEGIRACSRTPKASSQASGMTLPCVLPLKSYGSLRAASEGS